MVLYTLDVDIHGAICFMYNILDNGTSFRHLSAFFTLKCGSLSQTRPYLNYLHVETFVDQIPPASDTPHAATSKD